MPRLKGGAPWPPGPSYDADPVVALARFLFDLVERSAILALLVVLVRQTGSPKLFALGLLLVVVFLLWVLRASIYVVDPLIDRVLPRGGDTMRNAILLLGLVLLALAYWTFVQAIIEAIGALVGRGGA
jgi:Kef-type K+ transport system membrane component KefB